MRKHSDKEMKEVMFTVRLTQRQLKRLQLQASEFGVSEAEYIRKIIDKEPVVKVQTIKEINDLRLELHYISNNLNQVARALNRNNSDTHNVVEQVETVNDSLHKLLEVIMSAFQGK